MKPIYRPKGRAGEYSNYAINIYTGCNHGCKYCYAAKNAKRFGKDFTIVEPRAGIVEATKNQLQKFENEIIHLCFTCDPYPADIDTTTTREIIKAIKDSGNHVQILTKGGRRACRDFDLLDKNDWFGISYTGEFYERSSTKASSWFDGFKSLEMAKEEHNINTWVSIEPVLEAKNVLHLLDVERGEDGWVDFFDKIKIGKLNHYKPEDFGYPPINWKDFGIKVEQLCREYGRNYELKEDLRAEMEGLE